MRVLEFCGTPGCGKTTLSNQLQSELIAKGYDAKNYNELKGSKVKELFHFMFKKGFISTCCNLMTVMGMVNRDRFVYGIKIAIVCYQINEWSQAGKADYLLFDEGIIQYITTLSHGKAISKLDKLPSRLKPLYEECDTFVVDCKVDIVTNITRLTQRGNVKDRFVIDDEDKQKEALKLKENNIQAVISYFAPSNLVQIDTANESALNDVISFAVKG